MTGTATLAAARGTAFLADWGNKDLTGGRGEEFGKASPIGLLLILALLLAIVLLIRSMNRHLRKVPESFDPPEDAEGGGSGAGGTGPDDGPGGGPEDAHGDGSRDGSGGGPAPAGSVVDPGAPGATGRGGAETGPR